MRIVGGKNRGRALTAPKGRKVRPTSDRTRESVFNILSSKLESGYTDLTVVDLFSGTGAFGLEALSRGAGNAILVDNDRVSIKTIEENVQKLGETEKVSLLKRDATDLGPRPPRFPEAGLVFIDPPYDNGLAAPALNSLAENFWLRPSAFCIVETSTKENFDIPDKFELIDRRKYGKAAIYILRFAV